VITVGEGGNERALLICTGVILVCSPIVFLSLLKMILCSRRLKIGNNTISRNDNGNSEEVMGITNMRKKPYPSDVQAFPTLDPKR
jgi:hypothetical protein